MASASALAALIEVILVFGIVHVLFRAIKHFTRWGRWEGAVHLNFTLGLVMILFTACMLVLCRRNLRTYGLTLAQWTDGLKIGLLWGLLLVLGAALLFVFGVRHQPGVRTPTITEGTVYGVAVLGAVVLFAWLSQQHWPAEEPGLVEAAGGDQVEESALGTIAAMMRPGRIGFSIAQQVSRVKSQKCLCGLG